MVKRAIILILLLLGILLISGCSGTTSSQKVDKMTLMAGQNVVLIKDCFGAISKDAYDKLANYTATQNVQAADGLRQAGILVVLHTGDKAELEEVTMAYVKMKMLTGYLQGKSIYTFREMVEKVNSDSIQSAAKPVKLTDSNQNENLTTSRENINEEQKKIYKDWTASFDNKVSTYQELDNKALKIIADFKAKNISTSSKGKIEELWNQMDTVRTTLINLPTPDSLKAINKDIWKISGDYCSGVNDRQAALWKIIEYCDGVWKYDEALGLVNDCIKDSNDSFASSKKKRTEFDGIFQ